MKLANKVLQRLITLPRFARTNSGNVGNAKRSRS